MIKPIVVKLENYKIENNNDGTFTVKQDITPEISKVYTLWKDDNYLYFENKKTNQIDYVFERKE